MQALQQKSKNQEIISILIVFVIFLVCSCTTAPENKIETRGIYGHPKYLWDKGYKLPELGINAIFVHSSSIDSALIKRAREENLKIYAEFATLNGKNYIEAHPEAWAINEKGEKYINVNVRLPSGTLSQIQIYARETIIQSEDKFIQWDPEDEIEPGRNRVISEYYKLIKKGIIPNKIIKFWEINEEEAQTIYQITGLKVEGYIHVLDPYHFRHVEKKHGDIVGEAKQGQIAVEEEYFQLIPEVIKHPDKIEKSKTDKGLDAIIYSKKVDGTIIYIEEIQDKRNQLATASIRVNKY